MMPSFSFRSGEAFFSAKDRGHNFELFLWSWSPSLEIYNIQKNAVYVFKFILDILGSQAFQRYSTGWVF